MQLSYPFQLMCEWLQQRRHFRVDEPSDLDGTPSDVEFGIQLRVQTCMYWCEVGVAFDSGDEVVLQSSLLDHGTSFNRVLSQFLMCLLSVRSSNFDHVHKDLFCQHKWQLLKNHSHVRKHEKKKT